MKASQAIKAPVNIHLILNITSPHYTLLPLIYGNLSFKYFYNCTHFYSLLMGVGTLFLLYVFLIQSIPVIIKLQFSTMMIAHKRDTVS